MTVVIDPREVWKECDAGPLLTTPPFFTKSNNVAVCGYRESPAAILINFTLSGQWFTGRDGCSIHNLLNNNHINLSYD